MAARTMICAGGQTGRLDSMIVKSNSEVQTTVAAPIRVMHLIDSPNRRGAELFALDLAANLSPQDFDSVVVSLFTPEDGVELESPLLRRMDGNRSRWEKALGVNWLLLRKIAREASLLSVDVVISHGGATLRYGSALRLMKPGIRLIYRCIGTSSYWTAPGMHTRFMKQLVGRADAVICVSEHDRRDYAGLFGSRLDDIRVIDNGIVIKHASSGFGHPASAVRERLGVPEDAVLLISVGRISAEKNHRDVITVVKQLATTGVKAHAVIVGEGPLKSALVRASAECGLSDEIHLVGEQEDVTDLLKAADVFVLPSLTEGMPAALIEAGVAGLPVVSYDVGGVPELIDSGVDGYTVPVGDVSAMTARVADLARQKDLAHKIGMEAKNGWTRRFDIAGIAEQYATVIRQTAGRKSA